MINQFIQAEIEHGLSYGEFISWAYVVCIKIVRK